MNHTCIFQFTEQLEIMEVNLQYLIEILFKMNGSTSFIDIKTAGRRLQNRGENRVAAMTALYDIFLF